MGVSNMFSQIKKEHFHPCSENTAKDLFSQSVEMVEVETFSYCNRRCWFCPNSFVDRHSTNHYMEESLYLKVLDELSSIRYAKMISFSRYNEPLSDRIILRRLSQAKERCPNALLHTNSNGDYLTKEYLQELYEAGLRSLNLQVYLSGQEERFLDKEILARMHEMLQKLDLPYEITADYPTHWHEAELHYRDMKIRLYARNFSENGCDRGETIKKLGGG